MSICNLPTFTRTASLADELPVTHGKRMDVASMRPLGQIRYQPLPEKNAIPASLMKRPEDANRYEHNKEDLDRGYLALLALGCTVDGLPSNEDAYQMQLTENQVTGGAMLEEATLKLRQLEAEFQQQQALETEAKTGTDLPTAAKETSQEAGHEATERPGEQAQERVLLEEQHNLQRQWALLRCDAMKSWASTRLATGSRAQRDLREGVSLIGRESEVAMWTLFGVAGAYQHFWRMREARDELLEREVIGDKSMRKLLLGFVGLKRAHEAGIGDQAAMKLFHTLAKTHHAVGADVVPDSYLAYHTMCAQLFGTAKAAAILYPPLTEEEVEDHATWDLHGMYKAEVMNRMAGEHVGSWDHEGGAWSEEEMREVHVRRLRGPWGRLYAKELRKLRRLVRALDDQLFDVDAFEAAMLERLAEVRAQLCVLQTSVDHVVPSSTDSQKAKPCLGGSWWRRMLSWLSRLRGSMASKLRKLRDRLWGKREKDSTPSKATEVTEPRESEAMARLRRQLQAAKAHVAACEKRVSEQSTVLEMDETLTDQLGAQGELRPAVEAMLKSTWDIQDDIRASQMRRGNHCDDVVACLLLRLCYIDGSTFFEQAKYDVQTCMERINLAFKKGFKLRRKGHTDRVANMPGLGKEEMGMLTGLCAGMDGALEWLETYLQRRYNCIDN